jgi:N-acetylglucosamine kinase-like BadF-type ATPase
MRLFFGVDSGSTKTAAVLSDDSANILASAQVGSLNAVVRPVADVRVEFSRLCEKLIAQCPAVAHAGAASTLVGSAGIAGDSEAAAMRDVLTAAALFPLGELDVVNDVQLVLAAAIPGAEGIALISGTGSNCFGRRADGRCASVGGQEWLVDDRGSGFRIGLEGIVAAVRTADGRHNAPALQNRIFAALGISSSSDVIPRLHGLRGGDLIGKADVAALARIVIALAEAGDATACEILRIEVAELASMLHVAARRLELSGKAFLWTIAGSVGTNPHILERLKIAIQDREPQAAYRPLRMPPERGALTLAAGRAHHADIETFAQKLSNS